MTKRFRRWLPLPLVVAVAVATALATSGQALAADMCGIGGTSSPLTLANSDNPRGIVTHGVGSQLTIQGTGSTWAVWSYHAVGTSILITIEDASGNCLRVAHGNQATVANGCDADSPYQEWIPETSSPGQGCVFVNDETVGTLKTDHQDAGADVWVGPNMPGDFIKWAAF